jgi:hypothetical protein
MTPVESEIFFSLIGEALAERDSRITRLESTIADMREDMREMVVAKMNEFAAAVLDGLHSGLGDWGHPP